MPACEKKTGSSLCVSIIVPAYNAESMIGETIRSVLAQDFPFFELLIVDDGSTDSTADVVRSFSDARIRIIRQDNQGVCAARNRGLTEARGKYVVFLDADDMILPGKLSAQLAVYEAYRPVKKRLEIVNSGWTLIRADGTPIANIKPWEDAPQLTTRAWLLWKPVFPGALMLDRQAVTTAGGFDTSLKQAEDVDLILRMAAGGSEALWLHRPTVLYRQHGGNTIMDGLGQAVDLTRVLDKFFARDDLGKDLRKLERRVRFNTLIWLVWRLFQTGRLDMIPAYLKDSLQYSPYQPPSELTVVDWQVKLREHAVRDGESPQVLRALWPALREAADLSDTQWADLRHSLSFHLDLWQHYTFTDVRDIARYREAGLEAVAAMGAPVVFVSYRTRPEDIDTFHRTLKDAGMTRGRRSTEISGLYLILGTKKLYEGGMRDLFVCLKGVLKTGVGIKSLRSWARVFKPALRSRFHRKKKS